MSVASSNFPVNAIAALPEVLQEPTALWFERLEEQQGPVVLPGDIQAQAGDRGQTALGELQAQQRRDAKAAAEAAMRKEDAAEEATEESKPEEKAEEEPAEAAGDAAAVNAQLPVAEVVHVDQDDVGLVRRLQW